MEHINHTRSFNIFGHISLRFFRYIFLKVKHIQGFWDYWQCIRCLLCQQKAAKSPDYKRPTYFSDQPKMVVQQRERLLPRLI